MKHALPVAALLLALLPPRGAVVADVAVTAVSVNGQTQPVRRTGEREPMRIKEALNNIVRHARATEVRVALTVGPERFSLSVTDDGCGFAAEMVAGRGNGLTNMAARLKEIGGACEIVSEPGKGTTVRLSAPGGGSR